MKDILIDFIICPVCLPQERGLHCRSQESDGAEILAGSLKCDECGNSYPIRDGIAFLLPGTAEKEAQSKYEDHSLVSSYLWSHYGDIIEDREASSAYLEWASLIDGNRGFSLDAGCAVGRFTFEMANKSELAVGIDSSHNFIRTARELMVKRRLQVSLVEEGELMSGETIHLPETWSERKVEFVVGDVQALPFRANLFTSIASLNLLDKVPLPLLHLKEMNRVAKESGVQFLFSDPFSWSPDIARREDWLGGISRGPFSGRGIANIRSLLSGGKGELLPPWKIEDQGYIWWKIRNHVNHFELIRSCFIKASR